MSLDGAFAIDAVELEENVETGHGEAPGSRGGASRMWDRDPATRAGDANDLVWGSQKRRKVLPMGSVAATVVASVTYEETEA